MSFVICLGGATNDVQGDPTESEEAIIKLKKQHTSIKPLSHCTLDQENCWNIDGCERGLREIAKSYVWPGQRLATFLRRKNALVISTTSKGLENQIRQLKWINSKSLNF